MTGYLRECSCTNHEAMWLCDLSDVDAGFLVQSNATTPAVQGRFATAGV